MGTQKKGTKTPAKVLPIPEDQWKLPVAFSPGGTLVSLREYFGRQSAVLTFGQLSPEQQSELVAYRIEQQPKFEIAMIGAGKVDKKRAIQEVRARTAVGRALIEIEQRIIARMIARIT